MKFIVSMKIESVTAFKNLFTLSGIVTTSGGVFYAYFSSGDFLAYATAASGIALNSIGYLLSIAETIKAREEKLDLEQRLESMDRRIVVAHNRPATLA